VIKIFLGVHVEWKKHLIHVGLFPFGQITLAWRGSAHICAEKYEIHISLILPPTKALSENSFDVQGLAFESEHIELLCAVGTESTAVAG
jgi:hypothetical protein